MNQPISFISAKHISLIARKEPSFAGNLEDCSYLDVIGDANLKARTYTEFLRNVTYPGAYERTPSARRKCPPRS